MADSPADPLPATLNGVALSVPFVSLLTLNGNVFGVSGFLHRAVKGNVEGICAVSGMLLGGMVVGGLSGQGPRMADVSLATLLCSGLLVGCGTKLANGCTSGHMMAGVARLSRRSIAATATFISTAAVVARIFHNDLALPLAETDAISSELACLQLVPILGQFIVYEFSQLKVEPQQRASFRLPIFFLSALDFALVMRLSNFSNPNKVLRFLLTPLHPSFDPALFYLALGALPALALGYKLLGDEHRGLITGTRFVPKGGKVDARLIGGAALFGVGWGLSGICPGPGIVNLGQSLVTGQSTRDMAGWMAAAALGGLLV